MHPVYSPVELDAVKVVRHKTETVTDRMAAGMVKFARWGFDFVTGYKVRVCRGAQRALVARRKLIESR